MVGYGVPPRYKERRRLKIKINLWGIENILFKELVALQSVDPDIKTTPIPPASLVIGSPDYISSVMLVDIQLVSLI